MARMKVMNTSDVIPKVVLKDRGRREGEGMDPAGVKCTATF